jgi:tRNA threonylcarbamoyl adenosine modification protein (Sua5/YciO/YrdC/YwlC family)
MLFEVHHDNPDLTKLKEVAAILSNGGIVIYPTDTVYAMGCSLQNKKAIQQLAKLKDLKLKKANFSIIFYDLSQLSEYTKRIDRSTYKILNKNLPGPFTFILEASSQIPKLFDTNKKTVGIRIPENNIVRELVKLLGHPLVTTSLHDEDTILEYTTDPQIIDGNWHGKVDAIIDGGYGNNVPSTVVDMSQGVVEIIRQGIGDLRE